MEDGKYVVGGSGRYRQDGKMREACKDGVDYGILGRLTCAIP